MKTKLIAGFLLAGSCLFAAPRIAIGVGIGVPVPAYGYYAPAPVYVAPAYVPPPIPGLGYWAASRAYFGVRGRFPR
jgi:hypothetical protein